MNLAYYKSILEPHKRALEKIELELDFFLRDVTDTNIVSVHSRIKLLESARYKSDTIGVEIKKLDDLAGLRVIVGTYSEIQIIERFFTRQEYGKDLTIIKRNEYKRKTGYRAVHLIVELNSHYLRSAYVGRVEIQIQTVFSNAFNFLSRTWLYKSKTTMSENWNKKFLELGDTLNELEIIADSLHKEVIKNTSKEATSLMTPHSLIELIHQEFGETISKDDATDICRSYSDMGYITNGQLRSFFQSKQVIELREQLLEQAKENQSIKVIVNIPKNSFWSMFGTRINTPSLNTLLKNLSKKPNKKIKE